LISQNYREFAYYAFGLKTGARNFLRSGFGAGFRATASSLLQPVNSYTRFPEYYFLEEAVSTMVRKRRAAAGARISVLDVGSPKLAGLYLAARYPVRLTATDISPLAVAPYERMWRAAGKKSRGEIEFELRDARRLADPDAAYDLAYALSVLEHVEGPEADTAAAVEMLRVLEPGGTIVLSVPYGPRYVEQTIAGVAHAVERVRLDERFFFQRIYDRPHIEKNFIEPLSAAADVRKIVTVRRRESWTAAAASALRGGLPESLMTSLGFLNPFLSRMINRHDEGLAGNPAGAYGPVHSFGDVYGDVILVFDKRPTLRTESGAAGGRTENR
jgi:SAM-dependent methyltransferase